MVSLKAGDFLVDSMDRGAISPPKSEASRREPHDRDDVETAGKMWPIRNWLDTLNQYLIQLYTLPLVV